MCNCAYEMSRYTAFKFCLDPTAEQQCALARHAGAARFAYNQCLRMVKDALDARRACAATGVDVDVDVPFSAIDLINRFNEWKNSESAGRVFAVDHQGVAEIGMPGLPWRDQVCNKCSRVVPFIAPPRSVLGGIRARATDDVGLAFPSSSR